MYSVISVNGLMRIFTGFSGFCVSRVVTGNSCWVFKAARAFFITLASGLCSRQASISLIFSASLSRVSISQTHAWIFWGSATMIGSRIILASTFLPALIKSIARFNASADICPLLRHNDNCRHDLILPESDFDVTLCTLFTEGYVFGEERQLLGTRTAQPPTLAPKGIVHPSYLCIFDAGESNATPEVFYNTQDFSVTIALH
ncbi:MAG: hypothetical protein FP831_03750 [Anaerolineae bacterium]|nr:hypothetical protein [Anaerolineae bacterium]